MRRRALALLTIGVAIAIQAPAASAHVTAAPATAAAGDDVDLAFTVVNERTDAATTKVEVTFPTGFDVRLVRMPPTSGWTTAADTRQLADPIDTDEGPVRDVVQKVIWANGRLTGSGSMTFHIVVGPVPDDAGPVAFPTVQTYDDGQVVRWEENASQVPPPENPAPVLTIGSATSTSSTTATTATDRGAEPTAADTDDTTRLAAYAALVLSVAALVVAVLALRRRSGG